MTSEQIVTKIFQKLSASKDVPPTPGVISLTGWNDKHLDDLASNLTVPLSLKTLTNHQGLLFNFYTFYFTGQVPSGSSPHQVVYPFLCLLRHNGDEDGYLFSNDKFSNDGFFKPANIPTPVPIFKIDKYIIPTYSVPEGLTPKQIDEMKLLYLTESAEASSVFANQIALMINGYDSNKMTEQNYMIMRLTGFLALLLFRGISKDAIQLLRAMSKKLIKDHIHNLVGWPISYGYSPPCKTCIENSASDLNKGNSHANKMMTLILKFWKDASEANQQAKGLVPQLLAGVLTHTAGNGLGLVMLLFGAAVSLGATLSSIADHTLTENSKESWNLLVNFLETYNNKEKIERSYLWARLINDGYFNEFTARSHPYLAGMFAGIVDAHQPAGTIKDAAWFRMRKVLAEPGYMWGQAVVAKLSHVVDSPLTEGTKGVKKYLDQIIGEQKDHIPEPESDPFADVPIEYTDK